MLTFEENLILNGIHIDVEHPTNPNHFIIIDPKTGNYYTYAPSGDIYVVDLVPTYPDHLIGEMPF